MTLRMPEPEPDLGGIRTRRALLSAGISPDALKHATRRGRLSRPFRAVYVSEPAADPALLARAAHEHLGPESVAVLHTAGLLHGIQGGPSMPPTFCLPPGLERAQRPGLLLHFWSVPDDQVCHVDGIPTTDVSRTLADIARHLPRMSAVACVDSALHLGLIASEDLDAVAGLMVRKRRCVTGRMRLLEARVGAQSPLETRVRLRASDGGCPPDALQVPIRNGSGVLLGYGDFGYRLPDGTWLVVEADGHSVHELPEAVLHDRRRQNAFVGADASVIRFTWADTLDASSIPGVLRPILRSAGWQPRRP